MLLGPLGARENLVGSQSGLQSPGCVKLGVSLSCVNYIRPGFLALEELSEEDFIGNPLFCYFPYGFQVDSTELNITHKFFSIYGYLKCFKSHGFFITSYESPIRKSAIKPVSLSQIQYYVQHQLEQKANSWKNYYF